MRPRLNFLSETRETESLNEVIAPPWSIVAGTTQSVRGRVERAVVLALLFYRFLLDKYALLVDASQCHRNILHAALPLTSPVAPFAVEDGKNDAFTLDLHVDCDEMVFKEHHPGNPLTLEAS
jgi:hypothetical protein